MTREVALERLLHDWLNVWDDIEPLIMETTPTYQRATQLQARTNNALEEAPPDIWSDEDIQVIKERYQRFQETGSFT